ncbi:MAG: M56 family metallopeptidase [Chitinophagaceae bacterium]|nr:M56 family metallopeptidase [Chitinophagaceae bacterium]
MIPYILHAGVILAGCLVFYKLLLQKETFYRLNRIVLLACLVLSFSLPMLRVPQQWSFQKAERPVVSESPELSLYSVIAIPDHTQKNPGTTLQQTSGDPATDKEDIGFAQAMHWLMLLYWFGVAVFGFNFLVQLVSLYYRAYSSPVIKDGRFRIVELSGDKAPCSFGNNIFINPEKYDWDTYNQILMHEKIHIEQGHTLDILLAEIIICFQWFNPFAWLYRKELENNLEFLTDDQLLNNPVVEKSSYQMSLLKVSAPHFPLSLTTNYNQSLLKKRLVMMNTKRSNVHTTWKYFFILPLLVLFVCLLNEPVVIGQSAAASKNNTEENDRNKDNVKNNSGLQTEGAWFATIKDDKVSIQFKNDDDDHSFNTSFFLLSELKDIPREKSGSFSITRDAGTIQFTGRFEGNSGMGRYKFSSDKSFTDFLRAEGIEADKDNDQMAFFMVDLKKSYIQMLKQQGYSSPGKNELLPLAALKVDAAYIESLKKNGFSGLAIHEMISLKALGVNGDYIQEIRKAGYTNVTANQLVSFKAQGIDGKFITDMRNAAKKEGKEDPVEDGSADDMIAIKAMNVDAAYIQSLKEAGFDDLSNSDLIAMKAQGITAVYIKNLQAAGYKNMSASDLIAIKAQNITPEFIKGFSSVGLTSISFTDAIPLKSMGITPEYIKSFQELGYQHISVEDAVSLKAQGITPGLIKEYKALGYTELSIDEVVAAKATGTTPLFISSMKEKGHNLKSIQKYIQLKTAIE